MKSYSMVYELGHHLQIIFYNTFLWVGVSFGAFTSLVFFKQVRSISIRGLIICSGFVPMCLYSDFLMWSYENEKRTGFP